MTRLIAQPRGRCVPPPIVYPLAGGNGRSRARDAHRWGGSTCGELTRSLAWGFRDAATTSNVPGQSAARHASRRVNHTSQTDYAS